METSSVNHSTFIIERNYGAAPHQVFAAWADPAQKRLWFADGEHAEIEEHRLDFRVGGIEKTRRIIKGGPFEGTPLTNDSVYLDIVPDRRIVFAYTMTLGDKRISSSQATAEFLPNGKGTILAFTEQGAFFEGADGPEMREQGWKSLIGQLEKFLAH
jgi:uncharacterized protein YndB with AHSA1/START domain